MVSRIFVEKKPGFDVEAAHMLQDMQENLGLTALRRVRILARYDIENIDEHDLEQSINNVFSEPAVDIVTEKLETQPEEKVLAVEYLPGQYDQRADSAAQCVSLLTKKERPLIRTARIYVFAGVDDAQLDAIRKYIINPVDSREASDALPDTLEMPKAELQPVETVQGFIGWDEQTLYAYRKKMDFAMSDADILFAQNYFIEEMRDPTMTELKVIDTYWSDHCRHTTFSTKLTEISFGEHTQPEQNAFFDYLAARKKLKSTKDICLMDLAVMYPKEAKKNLKDLDVSEEINACSIKKTIEIDGKKKDYLIMFKNETHNHPTEIEPFGGAATCLGGAIRDPLSGRSYVYQAMRVTGAADPRESLADTMDKKLPQRKITREAAHGYSSYGNQIGLATGIVHEVYHTGYKAKRMEIGAVIAAAPKENVVRLEPDAQDVVVLIGGATGRDGCGGATGSSKAHDEKSIETCGAEVQKGNPLTERKLQRLFRNPAFSKLVRRCNDFGAGGVCVAIGELADGLDIDLDCVPKKYEGLTGTELAISESQERMAVVVRRSDLEQVLRLAEEENLQATKVADVTDLARMRMQWNGQTIVDLKRSFLDSHGAKQYAKAEIADWDGRHLLKEEIHDLNKKNILQLMGDLNICSQKGLIEMFDGSIGAASVTMPLGGKTQTTPVQAMAAKIPCDGQTDDVSLMSFGLDPYLMEKSPFAGTVYAILSSVAKIVAAGGKHRETWLTLQEYFERMGDDPKCWGKPLAALLGAYWTQKQLQIAAIGGKDSMSGTFMDIHVPPTVCSFAVAMTKAGNVVTPEFKQPGSKIYLLDIERDEQGLPVFADVHQKYDLLEQQIAQGKILSAFAVERGGILAGAVQCALGNEIGVTLLPTHKDTLTDKNYGAVMVESTEDLPAPFECIGVLKEEAELQVCGRKISLSELRASYEQTLSSIFPFETKTEEMQDYAQAPVKEIYLCKHKVAQPHVVLPVFPGTNCEYDSAAAFRRAGAQPDVLVINNLTPQGIAQSIEALCKAIKNAQIIMLPGGFSGGDEPDGSGKFIATTFRNPQVADAVHDLLKNRDGLMLGICNGFQALIKLGLVPYGEIRPMRQDSPTLTFNRIGRHVSRMVDTRITSANSPWLSCVKPGDIHTIAVSHGEGRFVATPQETAQLFANGQVATQYVGFDGQPTMDSKFNPNGSVCAIEGILSPDGRVLGKMGHSERATAGTFKNVPGNHDQHLFESGVNYFK